VPERTENHDQDEKAHGVRQFLDLGSGLPTRLNVHQIARNANRDARVVYVDYDRVAVLHAQAILNDRGWAAAIEGDIRTRPASSPGGRDEAH
jgi:hypothetical protein